MLVLVRLLAPAVEPPGYYATAENKSGAELRTALHHIIKGHRVIPYSSSSFDTADAMMVLDQDPANTNNLILVYGGRSEPKSTLGLSTGWNREHLWPNSYGLDDIMPSFSDLHNLRPADANVNSARNNKFYDETSSLEGPSFPGHPEAPLTSTDNNSWEPAPAEKGDIARALFYMMVRYTGDRPNEPALFLTDALAGIDVTNTLMGRMTTLLEWHLADPVDDRERSRNDMIYGLFQTNRNPFVDRPQWVKQAFWPVLLITAEGSNLRLRWAAEFPAARVERSDNALSGWILMPNAPTFTNGTWNVVVPVPNPRRFYRLRLE